MTKPTPQNTVRLDLNNPIFQQNLFELQKPDRHSALETLNKLRRMTWSQLYAVKGLKWEKIAGVPPPSASGDIFLAYPSGPARHRLQRRRLHASADDRSRSRFDLREKVTLGPSLKRACEPLEIMIGGGGEIYAQTIGMAHRLYITEVGLAPAGDAVFSGHRYVGGERGFSREGHAGAARRGGVRVGEL